MSSEAPLSLEVASSTPQRTFSVEEHSVWATILKTHRVLRSEQLVPSFEKGLRTLHIEDERIPDLKQVNRRLAEVTGWRGVYVKGLESAETFFPLLKRRLFPIGNFVRDRADLSYTPAPDVVHDLYGHLPLLTDGRYADFCQRFGALACAYLTEEKAFRALERFFWFTIEFGLVDTPKGRRILGAGIASSIDECAYALSSTPKVLPFDIDLICDQPYRVDQVQPTLFVLESPLQLYNSLGKLEQRVRERFSA